MCFSASASFGSAAFLIAVGTATTLGNREKSHRMIAAVPLLFGIQQLAEGVIWQTMEPDSSTFLRQMAVLTFLVFALVVWPSYIPWSIFNVEKNEKRKKTLQIISAIGLGVSMLAAWVVFNSNLSAYISGHSLGYNIVDRPEHPNWPSNVEFLLYVVPTLLPFSISSLKTVKNAGYLVFGSMLIAQIINKEASASIWCFFASLISFYIAVNVLSVQKGKVA